MKVKITKCYLIQILDDNDNEIKSEYVFGSRKDAERDARELKEEIKNN